MLPHHEAWLAAHPHRSAEWLAEQTRDGFDVHHLDGDHGNNDPENLVLIEHTDHMMVHGGRMLGRLTTSRAGRKPRGRHTFAWGRAYYERKMAERWGQDLMNIE